MVSVGVSLPKLSSGLYYDATSRKYYVDQYGKYEVPSYEATALRSGTTTLPELAQRYAGEEIKQQVAATVPQDQLVTSTARIDIPEGGTTNITTTTTDYGDYKVTEKVTKTSGVQTGYSLTTGSGKTTAYTEQPIATQPQPAKDNLQDVATRSAVAAGTGLAVGGVLGAASAAPVIGPLGIGAGLVMAGKAAWDVGAGVGTKIRQDFFGGAPFWDFVRNPKARATGAVQKPLVDTEKFVYEGIPFLAGLGGTVAGGYIGAKAISSGYKIKVGETKTTGAILGKKGELAVGKYGTATPYEVTWGFGKGKPVPVRQGVITTTDQPFIAGKTKIKDVGWTLTKDTLGVAKANKKTGEIFGLGVKETGVSKLGGFFSKETGLAASKTTYAGVETGKVVSGRSQSAIFDLTNLYGDIPKITRYGGRTGTGTSGSTKGILGTVSGPESIIPTVKASTPKVTVTPQIGVVPSGPAKTRTRESSFSIPAPAKLDYKQSQRVKQTPAVSLFPMASVAQRSRSDEKLYYGTTPAWGLIEIQRQPEDVRIRPIQAEDVRIATIPILKTEITAMPPPEKPPTFNPLPPFVPTGGIGFGVPSLGGGGKSKKIKTKTGKRAKKYQPSLLGIATKAPSLKNFKIFTGLEIRG